MAAMMTDKRVLPAIFLPDHLLTGVIQARLARIRRECISVLVWLDEAEAGKEAACFATEPEALSYCRDVLGLDDAQIERLDSEPGGLPERKEIF